MTYPSAPGNERFDLTLYPTIYSLTGVATNLSWPEIVESFSSHLRLSAKDQAPGFGPYALVSHLDRACGRPRHPKGPHRCDSCVNRITLAVFDVDCGTLEDIERTDRLLEKYARLWYSSWSYDPKAPRPALRLVVPLSSPIEAERWPSWRENFIAAYRVPADVRKCGGLSHFYYAPSCPTSVEPLFDATGGVFFDPSTLPASVRRRPVTTPAPSDCLDLDAPVDPEKLHAFRVKLRQSVSGLKRSSKPEARVQHLLLEKLLDGEPLAQHGSRNQTMTSTVFHLVRRLGDLSLAEGMALVDPSLTAMMAEGSSLTRLVVARMFETAFQKVEAQRQRDQHIEALLLERLGMSAACVRR